MNRANLHTVAALKPIASEKLPDKPQLTWVHAIVRAMFGCGPTLKSNNEVAVAFSDVLYPEATEVDNVVEVLGNLLRDARLADLVILELSSKYYFRRGRQERNNNDLAIADRLLRVGLAADPDDRTRTMPSSSSSWLAFDSCKGNQSRPRLPCVSCYRQARSSATGAQLISTLPWSTN